MVRVEEKGSADERDDYTEDGSVDLKGRPVLRSNTGRWKACYFIVGAYIADAHLGRYWTFVIASAIYLMGMSLLTLAVSLPDLIPPSCGHGIKEENCNKRASDLQEGIFYCTLYISTIGTGGTKPNISTMGADQFDDFEPKMFQVLVAAVRKWNVPVPNDPKELHELSLEEYSKSKKFIIDYTPSLRFLDKAAVKSEPNSHGSCVQ
ncbi:hypothetical protein CRYUN_Cryun20dG0088500 [Craigia yunnanensis]